LALQCSYEPVGWPQQRLLPPVFFFSSRGRHTRFSRDWSSDVCSSDLSDGRFLPASPSGPQSRAKLPGAVKTPLHDFRLVCPEAAAKQRQGLSSRISSPFASDKEDGVRCPADATPKGEGLCPEKPFAFSPFAPADRTRPSAGRKTFPSRTEHDNHYKIVLTII